MTVLSENNVYYKAWKFLMIYKMKGPNKYAINTEGKGLFGLLKAPSPSLDPFRALLLRPFIGTKILAKPAPAIV